MNTRSIKAILLLAVLLLGLWMPVSYAEDAADADDPWSFAIRHGSRDTNMIAITVDDCANIEVVENIFRLCEQYEVCVTFFVVGRNIKQKDAAIWQEIAASPYVEIGNHSQKHYDWHKCQISSIVQDLEDMKTSLDSVLGYHYETTLVRPPYGHCSRSKYKKQQAIIDMAASCGYSHAILWDVSQTDASKALTATKNGSILLYHAYGKDYRCLKTLIPKLLSKGFQPVKVSTLLGLKTGGPVAGETEADEADLL